MICSEPGFQTAIIGGGAAGLAAAISARRKGHSAIICEKMPRLGKKVLISGGGRCNLLNEKFHESFYSSSQPELVRSVLSRFGKIEILNFFKELGLEVCAEEGRLFPVTNQASSVVKILELELARLQVGVELNFEVAELDPSSAGFSLIAKDGRRVESQKVILAGGGRSYPALGSDGNTYRLAERFGHRTIEPVPSAVPLVIKDRWCHLLQGQRITSMVKSLIGGSVVGEASGEVLFTQYGLSGTAILDVSETISIALHREKKENLGVSLDLIPFLSGEELADELARRAGHGFKEEDLLTGLLPNKFAGLAREELRAGPRGLKDKRFRVLGTRGWNEAEFTCGGIDARDVEARTLESKHQRGLYLAGEILDVQGPRGGYNLGWAWASGYIAGLTE
jgi:hypothetical protein